MTLGLSTPVSAATDPPASTADAKLEAFFRRYLDEYFEQQPSQATTRWATIGLTTGSKTFPRSLGQSGRSEHAGALADLPKEVEYAQLSRPGQVDFEILQHDLERTLWHEENTRPFEEDTRIYSEYINGSAA